MKHTDPERDELKKPNPERESLKKTDPERDGLKKPNPERDRWNGPDPERDRLKQPNPERDSFDKITDPIGSRTGTVATKLVSRSKNTERDITKKNISPQVS